MERQIPTGYSSNKQNIPNAQRTKYVVDFLSVFNWQC